MTVPLLVTLMTLMFGLIQTILVGVIVYIFRQFERSNAEYNAKLAEVNSTFEETIRMIYHDIFSHRHTKPDEEVFIPGKYQK